MLAGRNVCFCNVSQRVITGGSIALKERKIRHSCEDRDNLRHRLAACLDNPDWPADELIYTCASVLKLVLHRVTYHTSVGILSPQSERLTCSDLGLACEQTLPKAWKACSQANLGYATRAIRNAFKFLHVEPVHYWHDATRPCIRTARFLPSCWSVQRSSVGVTFAPPTSPGGAWRRIHSLFGMPNVLACSRGSCHNLVPRDGAICMQCEYYTNMIVWKFQF